MTLEMSLDGEICRFSPFSKAQCRKRFTSILFLMDFPMMIKYEIRKVRSLSRDVKQYS